MGKKKIEDEIKEMRKWLKKHPGVEEVKATMDDKEIGKIGIHLVKNVNDKEMIDVHLVKKKEKLVTEEKELDEE